MTYTDKVERARDLVAQRAALDDEIKTLSKEIEAEVAAAFGTPNKPGRGRPRNTEQTNGNGHTGAVEAAERGDETGASDSSPA